LTNLAASLARTHQHTLLSSRLSQSIKTRLLHPGAATNDILKFYVSLLRCLRMLDPSGFLLNEVAAGALLFDP